MNDEQLTLNVGKFGECLNCPQSGAPVSLQHKENAPEKHDCKTHVRKFRCVIVTRLRDNI